jgi:hypothetical protein
MELENYITSMEGKAKNTIRTYVSNYNRLRKHFDKDITDIPNMELIEHISAQESSNTKNGFITVAIQVKRMNDRDITDLTDYRETLKISLVTEIKKKNAALQEVLPDYSNLVEYTERLFDTGDHINYVINYLLLNYNVRNLDLDFKITTKMNDATDENTNYMVIMPNKVMYIRNRYKTKETYGSKTHKITDEKFTFAIKKIYQMIKKSDSEEYINPIIPNPSTISYRVQSATYKSLGEGAYAKICINHFRDDVDALQRISENRGSSLARLLVDYDIQLLEKE